ncbi:MAG: methylmalonyl-CoA mutase family protein [Actinobacteria bacterium]|nr:methylmalonyl-CoA mutase family protein [Actinomycetota bacterium]
MSDVRKTTKDILREKIGQNKRKPLFDKEALSGIKKDFEEWKSGTVKENDRNKWFVTPQTILGSEMPRELIYTPLNISDLDYTNDLGNSGQAPFTRGLHPNMYRGKKFTIRQINGFGGPEDTNERLKFMLKNGATGLSVIFDIPTVQMYDSDDPISRGQVGTSGVAIDSTGDMEILFDGVAIEDVTISLVTHYPSNTAILFPMFLAMAERRGVSWNSLRGSIQNDITLEEVVRSGPEYIPPRDCFRMQCDNVEFTRREVPNWNFITLNGYNLHDFGTSGITEMAVAISNGMETIDNLIARGYDVDWVGERLAFFWSIASDFFDEVSRIRAARRLWYKIMKHKYNAQNPRLMWMRCHVQTSGITLTRQEPLNNIIRAAIQALSAVMGGVQSLHVDSYDEAYAVPTEEAALLSLRTQQIIQSETAVTEVVDPLGGSYYVEALTNGIEKRILDEVEEIEKLGGYVAAIEKGWIHRKVANHFHNEQAKIEKGDIRVVGLNCYKSTYETPPINVFKYPLGVEERQAAKLAKLRETRNNTEAEKALKKLEEACAGHANIVPYSVQCARAGCTEGEIFKVFKKVFGLWKPPVIF